MRHALADAIVHRDKSALGLQASLDGSRQKLGVGEKWCNEISGQISERHVMGFGNKQAMPGKSGR
jgi:hypothetical protein